MNPNETGRHVKRGIRLTTKMSLVFAILLTFFIVSVGGTAIGFHSIRTDFQRYGSEHTFAAHIGEINRDVAEMQRHVQVFVSSGNAHSTKSVRRLGATLTHRIETAVDRTDDEPTRYRLEKMRKHLAAYLENFESVVKERRLRQRIIAERILTPAKEAARLLQSSTVTKTAGKTLPKSEVQKALTCMSLAQISSLRFLLESDSQIADDTLKQIREAKRILGKESAATNPTRTRIMTLLIEFELGFLRAVQATRGYSYFVNVVMAGEAAEFLFQAKKLEELSAAHMTQISAETDANTTAATRYVFGLSISAVVLGVIIALTFIRSVVKPITDITETFTRLGNDQDVSIVPGLNRFDEIGEMARSADVFRDRNRQTKQLLAESQRMARDLDAKAAQLERSNRELDSFAYVASHDLKSPLRAIDNLSEWIIEDAYDVLPDDSLDHLSLLRQRVGRMESLLNDLLEYSRAGRIESNVETINTEELVREVQETIDWPAEMDLQIDPDLPTVRTERLPLVRVFHNLLSNAVKYRSDGIPRVHVSGQRTESGWEFAVADNGLGIEPRYHEQIFEMFKRLHTQDDIEGSGMGLALIKKLVESFNGSIRVESELGKGTTFRFTWDDATGAEDSSFGRKEKSDALVDSWGEDTTGVAQHADDLTCEANAV